MWLFGLISYWANLFVKLSLRLGSLSLKDTKNLWASNKIEKPRIENVPTKTRNVSILLPAQYKEESRESNSISQFAQNNHRKTKLYFLISPSHCQGKTGEKKKILPFLFFLFGNFLSFLLLLFFFCFFLTQ